MAKSLDKADILKIGSLQTSLALFKITVLRAVSVT